MQVSVITATNNPMDVIGFAAGICYGKRDESHKRVIACIRNGHHSVLEHASVTLFVEGISRACLAQLTRHRLVSFCVESQRYCNIDTDNGEWFVTPGAVGEYPKKGDRNFGQPCARKSFDDAMFYAGVYYRELLEHGVKPEDARAVLPNACKTNLVMTCNARELAHILNMRMDMTAQSEICDLSQAVVNAICEISPQWSDLLVELGYYSTAPQPKEVSSDAD